MVGPVTVQIQNCLVNDIIIQILVFLYFIFLKKNVVPLEIVSGYLECIFLCSKKIFFSIVVMSLKPYLIQGCGNRIFFYLSRDK